MKDVGGFRAHALWIGKNLHNTLSSDNEWCCDEEDGGSIAPVVGSRRYRITHVHASVGT